MKYVTASLGALLVFGGALIALMLIPFVVFPQFYESITGLVAAYAVGLPLAVAAAILSFRATLRQYAPNAGAGREAIHCAGCGERLTSPVDRCPLCGSDMSQATQVQKEDQ